MRVLEHAAPADLPRVSIIGVETALEAMANASKLAIAADLDCWLDWCAGEHRISCPAEPEHIVRYLRALEADGKKPATLARRVASLATVHRMLGAESDLPTAAPMVRNALRANRRGSRTLRLRQSWLKLRPAKLMWRSPRSRHIACGSG